MPMPMTVYLQHHGLPVPFLHAEVAHPDCADPLHGHVAALKEGHEKRVAPVVHLARLKLKLGFKG